jgi:hypothetical protein
MSGVAGLGDRRGEIGACLLAAAADFGGDTAVLVVGGMPITFLGAGAAGSLAGLDHRADDAKVGLGLTRDDAARPLAGVGTVETQADAANQLRYVFLGKTGVCTARTGIGAVDALLDAAHQRFAIDVSGTWVELEHFPECHVVSFFERH